MEHIAPNGSVLSYLANREGSTVALTDSTGKVVAHYAYSAHGSIICGPITSPGTTPSGTLSPTSSPPCHPSPPAPPATCPTASQHSPVGHPPCLTRTSTFFERLRGKVDNCFEIRREYPPPFLRTSMRGFPLRCHLVGAQRVPWMRGETFRKLGRYRHRS